MKFLFFIFVFFLLTSCSNPKKVYWCGDHPCVNNKEKEDYFKKTMIVEIRSLPENTKERSEIEAITEQARKDQKKKIKEDKILAKQAKKDKKNKIKEEIKMSKQKQLEEDILIKEKNDCSNPKGFHKKMMCSASSKLTKKDNLKPKIKKEEKIIASSDLAKVDLNKSKFNELVEKINETNSAKSYPDINNIPE